MSIDYIYRYVDYYWRIAPSDKETTDRIGHYLDYIAAMNPYNAKRPLESIGLLLKTGNEKIAIQNLKNSISDLQEIGLGETKEAQSLIMKLKDVERNKAY